MASRYPEIKRYILHQIDLGNYKEGIMLPTEKEFTDLFQVSRMTVRRAFDELIQDGILIRKRGSGLFIAPKKIERTLTTISTQHDAYLHQLYNEVTIQVLEFKVVKDHYICRSLLHLENEEAYQIKRVQYGDKQPIVYENIFLPKRYFKKLKKSDALQSMSEITHHYFIKDETKNRNQITVEATLATSKVSSLLQIPANSPVLRLKNIVYDEEGNPCFCGINLYAGEKYCYQSK